MHSINARKRTASDRSVWDKSDAEILSYPRKRVAIACEVCRLRKTRCDAAKPSCSFCTSEGINCMYTGPSRHDRKREQESDVSIALQKLDDLQRNVRLIVATLQTKGYDEGPNSYAGQSVVSFSPPLTQTFSPIPISRMPNLFVFKNAHGTSRLTSYDCVGEFFKLQMKAEINLCDAIQSSNTRLDFRRPYLWRLQRSFVENILHWLPLFDQETATRHFQLAENHEELERDDASTCLTLMMFATGTIAADTTAFHPEAATLPGFGYFARASKILRTLPRSSADLKVLQSYILMSMYFLLAMQPLEAWRMICQASQACILTLKASTLDEGVTLPDAFRRSYWICYILESELEFTLELPSSGIRAYEEFVALPTSYYEEPGMYQLLALSSLRKLMIDVIDTVGLRSPETANYAPVVCLELRDQIDHWYQHLPGNIRFPLDDSVLFDLRKAFLKCMYYALIVVTFWPFVPCTREIYGVEASPSPMSIIGDMRGTQINGCAEECLKACRCYLRAAEEILIQKSLASYMIIRSYFATIIMLLLVYPEHDEETRSSDEKLLKHAIDNLQFWAVVPFMQKPLAEMKRIARLKGLFV